AAIEIARVGEKLLRPVHARHAIASLRKRQRQTSAATRYVQDRSAGRHSQRLRDAVCFALRVLGRHPPPPEINRCAFEKRLPPVRLNNHFRTPRTRPPAGQTHIDSVVWERNGRRSRSGRRKSAAVPATG